VHINWRISHITKYDYYTGADHFKCIIPEMALLMAESDLHYMQRIILGMAVLMVESDLYRV
jgi:hypothetical protein